MFHIVYKYKTCYLAYIIDSDNLYAKSDQWDGLAYNSIKKIGKVY